MTSVAIQLPEDLKESAERSAEGMGISLDQMVRELLEARLWEIRQYPADDPFLTDREVFHGSTPSDLVKNLDDYLYGTDD